jgi:hypothetical protein
MTYFKIIKINILFVPNHFLKILRFLGKNLINLYKKDNKNIGIKTV